MSSPTTVYRIVCEDANVAQGVSVDLAPISAVPDRYLNKTVSNGGVGVRRFVVRGLVGDDQGLVHNYSYENWSV